MKVFHRLALAAAIAAPAAALAAPKVEIDAPGENSIQSGVTQVYGWASDEVPVVSVEMYIDGDIANTLLLGMGGERGDVEGAFPDDFDPLHSGFATAFHTKLLSNGEHTITIVATNEIGETTEVTRTIIVSNTPDDDVLVDSVDLSGATARISGDHIFLDGVVINGVSYDNLELHFDDVVNGFRIGAFREDLDGDGFADDDHDRDGYHDDDHDRDGFHDDDDDKDGFSDDGPDHDMHDDHGGERPEGESDDGPGHDAGDDSGSAAAGGA